MTFRKAIEPHVIAMFRMVVGLLFAVHGVSSLFGVPAVITGTVPPGTWPGWYAAVIQLIGGGLVVLGAGTRVAALICSGSMAYAYFTVHQPQALWPIQNNGDLSALYAWAFLLLVVTGPGAWSVDGLFDRSRYGRNLAARHAERKDAGRNHAQRDKADVAPPACFPMTGGGPAPTRADPPSAEVSRPRRSHRERNVTCPRPISVRPLAYAVRLWGG
jgi:putative oxidoreductase